MFVKLLGKTKKRRKEDGGGKSPGGNGKLPFHLLLPPLHACPPMCVFMPALSHIFCLAFTGTLFLTFPPDRKGGKKAIRLLFLSAAAVLPISFLNSFPVWFRPLHFLPFLPVSFLFFLFFFCTDSISCLDFRTRGKEGEENLNDCRTDDDVRRFPRRRNGNWQSKRKGGRGGGGIL